MFVSFGKPLSDGGAIIDSSEIPALDAEFWRRQTEAIEPAAFEELSEQEIDDMFDATSAIIDEDLLRFDPMVHYFAAHFEDGDQRRIEIEREIAHSAKRDFAWMTIELALNAPGFFLNLKPWYDAGRWPHGWDGNYPGGKPIVT